MENLETSGLIILMVLFLYWVYVDSKKPHYYCIQTKKSLTNEQIEFIEENMVNDFTHEELTNWDISNKLIVQIKQGRKKKWIKVFAMGLNIDLVYIGRNKNIDKNKKYTN